MAGRKRLPARLPCPFCGNAKQADLAIAGDNYDGRALIEFEVVCSCCGAKGPSAGERHRAIEYWNTRPTEEPA